METYFYAQVSHGQFHIGTIEGHLFTIQADMEPTQCSTYFPGEQTYICEQVLFCLFTHEISRFDKDVLGRDLLHTNFVLLLIPCAEPFYTGTSHFPKEPLKLSKLILHKQKNSCQTLANSLSKPKSQIAYVTQSVNAWQIQPALHGMAFILIFTRKP